ncbi:HEPN domain-containing protein [Belnapia moabensis]|uniref:HEPN domain-containing protein n=1 Tax=Belnapia moabensis TaxID=365533 RepID=UPI0012ED2FD7|nr:HEPN domain-containing protein [Belnapia moabensis]
MTLLSGYDFRQPAGPTPFPHPRPPLYNADGNALNFPVYGPLVEALRSVPEVARVEGLSMRNGDSGSVNSVPLVHLAASLVAGSMEIGNPTAMVAALARMIAKNAAEAWRVAVLSGVRISDRHDLGNSLFLVPLDQVPDTTNKIRLLNREDSLCTPAAALVHIFEVRDFFCGPQEAAVVPKEHEARVVMMRDAADCIMIAADAPAGIVAEWTLIAEAAAPRFPDSIMTVDPAVAYTFAPDVALEGSRVEEAGDTLKNWVAFGGDKRSLRTACSRLRRSRRNHMHSEDRAIDLGIALEVLLSHGAHSDQEITYRLSTRGAWLAGCDAAERRRIAGQLKAVYGLRSKAVHTGAVPSSVTINGSRTDIFSALEEGENLCGRLVRAVLARDGWPDWETLTLGGVCQRP